MDGPTLGLVIVVALLGLLALTVVGVITAVPVVLVGFLVGSFARTSLCAIGLAAFWIASQLLWWGPEVWLLESWFFLKNAFHLYQDAFFQRGYEAIIIQWLRFFSVSEAWVRLTPMGLILGAIVGFALDACQHAANRQVGGDR